MKQTGFAFVLLAILLTTSCYPSQAQKSASKLAPVTTAPDLAKLNI